MFTWPACTLNSGKVRESPTAKLCGMRKEMKIGLRGREGHRLLNKGLLTGRRSARRMKVRLASGLWDSFPGRSKLRAEDEWIPPPLHKQLLLKIQNQQEQKLAYTHF